MTAAEYHADPAPEPSLSSSIAKILVSRSPAHAWEAHPKLNPNWVKKEEDKFSAGTIAHALLLQGVEVAEVLAFPDWRTNAAKEAKELARQHGRIPILAKHMHEVMEMVNAAAAQLEHIDPPIPFTAGKPEQCLIWEEEGVTCRALIDWLHDDLSAVDDYKTTSASAKGEVWSKRTLFDIGGDVQVAFHLRGIKAVTGATPTWRYVVQETYPPFALQVIEPGPDVLALGEAKVEKAISIWRRCMETGEWPAYPPGVYRAELPPWKESEWLARELQEEAA